MSRRPLARGGREHSRSSVCAVASAWWIGLSAVLGAQTSGAPQAPAPPTISVTVTVVGTTPLPGEALPLPEIPAPVQVATGQQIQNSGALDLSDFLNRQAGGVHVNENQGNPFQPDVNYRGYTASPLLGTPQGLSVYMDGVRLNQPFGEVVSWDLIPRAAIASTVLMPGSNPLFGLNTLGGALSIQTKDGRQRAGNQRRGDCSAAACAGQSRSSTAAAMASGIQLVRARQPVRRGRLARRFALDRAAVLRQARMAARRAPDLGIGVVRRQLADRQRRSRISGCSITTTRASTPSRTTPTTARRSSTLRPATISAPRLTVHRQRLLSANSHQHLQRRHQRGLARSVHLSARRRRACRAGRRGLHRIPGQRRRRRQHAVSVSALHRQRAAPGRTGGEVQRPAESRPQTRSTTAAGRARSRASVRWRGSGNQLTVGGGFDRSGVAFLQSTELGYLNPDRSITGVGAFGDGVTGGDVDGEPFDTRVDLDGRRADVERLRDRHDALGERVHVTLSGRYNRTTVHNRDRSTPAAAPARSTATTSSAGSTRPPASPFSPRPR